MYTFKVKIHPNNKQATKIRRTMNKLLITKLFNASNVKLNDVNLIYKNALVQII